MSLLSFPHSVHSLRVGWGDKTTLITKKIEIILRELSVTYYISKKAKSEGEMSLLRHYCLQM